MPWNPRIPEEVRTVHLGQFAPQHAVLIGERLDAAGIASWTKTPGFINRLWQLGVEIFVDRARLAEARAIADDVVGTDRRGRGSLS
jgi:hypothetical protein